MNDKDNLVFIEHILDSINAVKEFSKNINKDELISNRLKQSAIVREIEIIGEAVKNLPDKLKEKYPSVPWKEISGTRDRIIHHYFGVDLDIIWEIIKINLPDLKKKVLRIKREINED